MYKNHEAPEFQVIKQNEANAKFFVASTDSFAATQDPTSTSLTTTLGYTLSNSNGWF